MSDLSRSELEAQGAADLPDKEAMSVLDLLGDQSLLNLNVDLALDARVAAPKNKVVQRNLNIRQAVVDEKRKFIELTINSIALRN